MKTTVEQCSNNAFTDVAINQFDYPSFVIPNFIKGKEELIYRLKGKVEKKNNDNSAVVRIQSEVLKKEQRDKLGIDRRLLTLNNEFHLQCKLLKHFKDITLEQTDNHNKVMVTFPISRLEIVKAIIFHWEATKAKYQNILDNNNQSLIDHKEELLPGQYSVEEVKLKVKLAGLNAVGDDRTLVSHGHNRKYWYSIGDGFRLLIAIREKKLTPIQTLATNERYTAHQENQEGIFVTDPYYLENFNTYLVDDIKKITGMHEEVNINRKWDNLPRVIIIPILTGLHWRCIRVEIDYTSKKISILFDDPYGVGRFTLALKQQILECILLQLEKIIKISTSNEEFKIQRQNIEEFEKTTDQQGTNNGYDCGVIVFGNIEDYASINNSNQNFTQGNGYKISRASDVNHEEQMLSMRSVHINEFSRISGVAIDQHRLEVIRNQMRRENLKGFEEKNLSIDIAGKISALLPEYISMIFNAMDEIEISAEDAYECIMAEQSTFLSNQSTAVNEIQQESEAKSIETLTTVLSGVSLTKERAMKAIEELIKEGNELLELKQFIQAEYKYATAFRVANENIFFDVQQACLQRLGDVYLERKEYTRSTALYNTALVIAKSELLTDEKKDFLQQVLIGCIKKTERLFLEEGRDKAAPTSLISSHGSDLAHKEFLEQLREDCREELKQIDSRYNAYIPAYDEPERKKIELTRAEAVRKLYKTISSKMNGFLFTLLNEAQAALGDVPTGCKYAIIGLGSFARGEMTPYSDFEWAVLVNEEKKEYVDYFRKLTKLVHIKVLNLGETVLPTMTIDALNPPYPKNLRDDWFFDDITPNGFKFDGMMPRACKTPLGKTVNNNLKDGDIDSNGKKVFELIRTPQRMAELQGEGWFKDDELLPNEMLTCGFIMGDQQLERQYQDAVHKVLSQHDTPTFSTRHTRALKLLTEDLRKYDLSLNKNHDGKFYEIKKEIYRLADRVIDGLALYHDLQKTGSLDRIEELGAKDLLNEQAVANLKIAVTMAMELRLRAYLHNNGQREKMKIATLSSNTEAEYIKQIQEVFLIPNQEMLFRFYYRVLPFQQAMENFCSLNSITKSLDFKNKDFFDDCSAYKGAIYKRLAQYKKAEEELKKARLEPTTNALILDYRNSQFSMYESNVGSSKHLAERLLGEVLITLGKYEEAQRLFKSLGHTTDLEQGYIYHSVGECEVGQGHYKEAIEAYRKVSDILKKTKQTQSLLTVVHSMLVVQIKLNNFKKVKEGITEIEEILSILTPQEQNEKWGTLGITIGNYLLKVEEYAQAEEYFNKSLNFLRQKYGLHEDIATAINSIGICYEKEEKWDEALTHYQQSLVIREKLFGEQHQDVALSHNNIGEIYRHKGEFCAAYEEYQKAKNILEKVNQTKSWGYALVQNNRGIILLEQLKKAINMDKSSQEQESSYHDTLQTFKESLAIRQAIYCGKPHDEIASSLLNIGATYCEVEKYQKAERYFKMALAIREMVFKNQPSHPGIFNIKYNLASLPCVPPDKSIPLYNEILPEYSKIYGENSLRIAALLNNLSSAYRQQGNASISYELAQRAMGIWINSRVKIPAEVIENTKQAEYEFKKSQMTGGKNETNEIQK